MYKERKIYTLLEEHLSTRQVTVITGMRRTGKSTLLKELLKNIRTDNKLLIDLEKLDNRDLFNERNYENIVYLLQQRGIDFKKKSYIALDEIQLVPKIVSVLKYMYDEYDIKFILTGSSSFYMKNYFSESLSGRKKIFELNTLSFSEMLIFNEVPHINDSPFDKSFSNIEYERLKYYYELYIEYGGFPEVVLEEKNSNKKDILRDIIDSYINVDIKTISDVKNVQNIFNLIKTLSSRVGNRMDFSKLSSILGISRPTLYNYIYLLEQSFLISLVPVFANNPDREIVKAKKLYFNDNGIVSLFENAGSGAKFENCLFNQLRQLGALNYYATKSGKEIDFILNQEIGIEAKETPTERDLKQIQTTSQKAGVKKYRLVGRFPSPNFNDYVWGGDIR